ncbi:DUF4132 domain-containing protein [Spirillospora sp. NPDC047418]
MEDHRFDADVPPLPAPGGTAVPAFLTGLPWERPPVRPVVTGLERFATSRVAWPDGERDRWLGTGTGTGPVDGEERMRVLVARHGLDVLPDALRMAADRPVPRAAVVLPYRDVAVAALMCDLLMRRQESAALARTWLDWHGVAAVPCLVPAALGRPVRPRRAAETALRHLADRHGLETVASAAPEVADELRAVLAAHPVRTGLAKRPEIGDWADPVLLPPVLLRGRERTLPAEAVPRLVELLALRHPHDVPAMRDACDERSLAEFGWTLFDRWLSHGAPARDEWAFAQLARTGDDETVRRLVQLVRAWPGERGHAKARRGLDVLAALGSRTALAALYRTARDAKHAWLRTEAAFTFAKAAERRGLDVERLADRIVPDGGLDPAGRMKGEARRTATVERDRLERAMVAERRWSPAEFRDYAVRHPIVGHLARCLVWTAENGGERAFFRIAEDGTFADVDDGVFVLPGDGDGDGDGVRVGVAHPATMGATLEAWSELFADYEILQPFPQLGRPFYALTGQERDAGGLDRLAGAELPPDVVDRLAWRGWAPGEDPRTLWREIAPARRLVIAFAGPGPGPGGRETLREVRIDAAPADHRPGGVVPRFADLSPVALSEALAKLVPPAPAPAPEKET